MALKNIPPLVEMPSDKQLLKAILESNLFIARKLSTNMKEEREVERIGEGLV